MSSFHFYRKSYDILHISSTLFFGMFFYTSFFRSGTNMQQICSASFNNYEAAHYREDIMLSDQCHLL